MSNYFAKIGKAILRGDAWTADPAWGWNEAPKTASGQIRWRFGRGGDTLPTGREERCRALEIRSFNDLHGAFWDPAAERDRLHFWAPEWKTNNRGPVRFLFGVGDDHVGVPRWDEVMDTPSALDPAYALYASVGVDAIVPGNHDLDWGATHWREKIAPFSDLSFVWSNLADAGEAAEWEGTPLAPAWILERGGFRVGVLGVLSDIPAEAGGVEVCDPVEALIGGWAQIREHVDCGVVLSHLGDDTALRAQMPPDVFVFGAHVHRFEPFPSEAWESANLLVAGAQGTHLGEARFESQDGKGRWQARILQWPEMPENAPVSAREQRWNERFARAVKGTPKRASQEPWPSILTAGHADALAWMAGQMARLPLAGAERRLGVDGSLGLIGEGAITAWPPPSPIRDRVAWRQVFPFQDSLVTTVLSPARALALMAVEGWTTAQATPEGAACSCGGGNGAVRLVTHSYAAKGLGPYAEGWKQAGIDPAQLPWQDTGLRLRDFLWEAMER